MHYVVYLHYHLHREIILKRFCIYLFYYFISIFCIFIDEHYTLLLEYYKYILGGRLAQR